MENDAEKPMEYDSNLNSSYVKYEQFYPQVMAMHVRWEKLSCYGGGPGGKCNSF